MDKDKTYIVNMGFQDDSGRVYNAGQKLTQIEYNLLPMNMKVRCSEDFVIGEQDNPFKPKS